jgi:hypothetical protein
MVHGSPEQLLTCAHTGPRKQRQTLLDNTAVVEGMRSVLLNKRSSLSFRNDERLSITIMAKRVMIAGGLAQTNCNAHELTEAPAGCVSCCSSFLVEGAGRARGGCSQLAKRPCWP